MYRGRVNTVRTLTYLNVPYYVLLYRTPPYPSLA